MKFKLVVVAGETKTKAVRLRLPTVIGRAAEATLTLPHALVSRKHCEIFAHNGKAFIKDFGSTNGTFLADKRLEANIDYELLPGQLLTIGDITFRAAYELEDPALMPPDFAEQAPADDDETRAGVDVETKQVGVAELEGGRKPAVADEVGDGDFAAIAPGSAVGQAAAADGVADSDEFAEIEQIVEFAEEEEELGEDPEPLSPQPPAAAIQSASAAEVHRVAENPADSAGSAENKRRRRWAGGPDDTVRAPQPSPTRTPAEAVSASAENSGSDSMQDSFSDVVGPPSSIESKHAAAPPETAPADNKPPEGQSDENDEIAEIDQIDDMVEGEDLVEGEGIAEIEGIEEIEEVEQQSAPAVNSPSPAPAAKQAAPPLPAAAETALDEPQEPEPAAAAGDSALNAFLKGLGG